MITKIFLFDVDHPIEFQRIKALISKVTPRFGENQLRYQLGSIVYGFKRRFRDPDYEKNMKALRTQLLLAAAALGQAEAAFREVDEIHSHLFYDVIQAEQAPGFDDTHIPGLINDLTYFSAELMLAAKVVETITSPEARNIGRSRPPLPYLMPTLALIELWQSVTGRPVVSPRGTASVSRDGKAEAVQLSTEFIRLGLTMIDPKVTAANAVTITRNALAARKTSSRPGKQSETVSFALRTAEAKRSRSDPAN